MPLPLGMCHYRTSDTFLKKQYDSIQRYKRKQNLSGDIKTSKFSRGRKSKGAPLCTSSEWQSSRQEPTPVRKSDTTTLTTNANSNCDHKDIAKRSIFIKSGGDIVAFAQECY